MKVENTKQQMRKGILEFCILSILKDRDLYASEILKRLKEAQLLSGRRNAVSTSHKT